MSLRIKGQNQFYLIVINLNCIQDSSYHIAGRSICGYKQQASSHSSQSKTGPYSSPSLFHGFESSYPGNFILSLLYKMRSPLQFVCGFSQKYNSVGNIARLAPLTNVLMNIILPKTISDLLSNRLGFILNISISSNSYKEHISCFCHLWKETH